LTVRHDNNCNELLNFNRKTTIVNCEANPTGPIDQSPDYSRLKRTSILLLFCTPSTFQASAILAILHFHPTTHHNTATRTFLDTTIPSHCCRHGGPVPRHPLGNPLAPRPSVHRVASGVPAGLALRPAPSLLRLHRPAEGGVLGDPQARPAAALLHREDDEDGSVRWWLIDCATFVTFIQGRRRQVCIVEVGGKKSSGTMGKKSSGTTWDRH